MHAVLTGDIVGSSGLSPEGHREVVAIVKSVAGVFPDAVVGRVDVFSGDSWQMLVSDCGMSLRIALYLRASLKREKAFSVDSRVSIAWGETDMEQVSPERISESTGGLFTASGRGLRELRKPALMAFAMEGNETLRLAVDAALRLLDTLVRTWSPEQARAVAATLLDRTQAEIAAEFGVGQSSVNKSLQAAFWPDIEPVLEQLEQAVGYHLKG